MDIAKQLAEAVLLLHSKTRIAHFDIKPDNVLLDADGNCYLCDFSIAKEIPSHVRAVLLPHDAYGSTEYMAPEQVQTTLHLMIFLQFITSAACYDTLHNTLGYQVNESR